jgi:hypothetical protein
MAIPLCLKVRAILIDIIEEKCVKQPKMVSVLRVEHMPIFETSEEGPPSPGKLSADFNPQPLDSRVSCRAYAQSQQLKQFKQEKTYDPHMNDARRGPFLIIM